MSWKQSHCFSFCCHFGGRYTINISHNLFGFTFIDADCKTKNKYCVGVKAWSGEGSYSNIPDVNGKCLIREYNLAITNGTGVIYRVFEKYWYTLIYSILNGLRCQFYTSTKTNLLYFIRRWQFFILFLKNGKGAI